MTLMYGENKTQNSLDSYANRNHIIWRVDAYVCVWGGGGGYVYVEGEKGGGR